MRYPLVKWLWDVFVGVALCALVSQQARPQGTKPPDPFSKRTGYLQLQGETIRDGLGKLNQTYDVGFSIELVSTPKGARRLPANPKFTASIENKNLGEAMDWLCGLDARFTWVASSANPLP
jgi:hypothetical protein